MPKQKQHNLKRYQGSSSTSSTKPTTNAVPSRSVNVILGELRIADDATATAIKQRLSENAKSTSLPPELGRLIDPNVRLPPPVQVARPFARARRFAGPAPPRSWLQGDLTGSSNLSKARSSAKIARDKREQRLYRFERLCGGNVNGNGPKSLQRLCLMMLAKHWQDLDLTHYEALAEALPLTTRLDLLSHLGVYADEIGLEVFRVLISGHAPLEWLDLAGQLNGGTLSIKALIKMIKKDQQEAAAAIPDDSWEAMSTSLPANPSTGKFSRLTHLCLSHPAPTILWDDLLKLVKLVPALTHLSIAYWPAATRTPNLLTTTVTHSHGEISAGGTHFYSDLDGDLVESCALLRQLSASTLQLRWLDIEGVPMLLKAMARIESHVRADEFFTDADLQAPRARVGITDSWRNLSYIRVAGDLEVHRPKGSSLYHPTSERAQQEATRRGSTFNETEQIYLSSLCGQIEATRRSVACTPVDYDLGWNWRA